MCIRDSAYYDFFRACDELNDPQDIIKMKALADASTRALLFSSQDTQSLISQYGNEIMIISNLKHINSDEVIKRASIAGKLRGNLIKSMQNDLGQ